MRLALPPRRGARRKIFYGLTKNSLPPRLGLTGRGSENDIEKLLEAFSADSASLSSWVFRHSLINRQKCFRDQCRSKCHIIDVSVRLPQLIR